MNPHETSLVAQIYFCDRIVAGDPFALARFGDGELEVLNNLAITGHNAKNRGFAFTAGPEYKSRRIRQRLFAALLIKDEDYFVGVTSACCSKWMYENYLKFLEGGRLTYNNLWVNGNFKYALINLPRALRDSGREVFIVCREDGDVTKLDFPVREKFPVANNAWINSDDTGAAVVVKARQSEGAVFLFAAGPYSELLIAECFAANRLNFYIDIGSVFNPLLLGGPTRGYHRGKFRSHICRA